ncbi:benzoate/H(+) symporter BenE family transporter [Stenotrophomonas rhizophila]|uniref:benzoate/H(+) symporter BenE family transporter n=1 Tax=Stenotrophomonas rhizophila TaxID=216778 RepID=UPI001E32E1B7|nr:benzoate/H(+) symporter BenE family transporter [Stenotrophomonas rhizophila]MCC7633385.1 benzoate/H(+) symporter BenE family transporter [Stenotrophomonas rhizophila]MCC7662276.1 benzoate/H(+) symporter BenE family transporter [Stenotrophomonas rhizophila]
MSVGSKRSLLRDVSLPSVMAGFITVLVGFASSAVIVFQAAQTVGASQAQIASWMWALGLGMGVTCIGLSLRYRVPVVTAWSTPGAAMLVVGTGAVGYSDAIGAFVLAAVLGMIAGFSGIFARAMRRVPMALASGMLAGVLLRFGLEVFVSMGTQLAMALAMFATWLVGRRLFPRYAVVATLLVGIAVAGGQGLLQLQQVRLEWAVPVFTTPTLSWPAVFSIALPLFVVTMASQNIPGVAVIRACGYDTPVSPVIGWIGVVNTLLAPFGAFGLNLAAITAAICMGREAHEDPARRYTAAVAAGAFYIVVGLFGATVAAVFAAFPRELVACVAGIALFGTIANSLAGALREEADREAALVTFLVTASGLSLAGIGSAFWGLVAGGICLLVLRPRSGRG